MDKELLAKKLYCKRVSSLAGSTELDGNVLGEMWESKTSPSDAVKPYSQMRMNLKALLGYLVISIENKQLTSKLKQ